MRKGGNNHAEMGGGRVMDRNLSYHTSTSQKNNQSISPLPTYKKKLEIGNSRRRGRSLLRSLGDLHSEHSQNTINSIRTEPLKMINPLTRILDVPSPILHTRLVRIPIILRTPHERTPIHHFTRIGRDECVSSVPDELVPSEVVPIIDYIVILGERLLVRHGHEDGFAVC